MKPYHSLLKRQLQRCFEDSSLDALDPHLQKFIEAVNDAYQQSDEDRSLLERSLELSSDELLQANSEMRAVFKAFPDLFFRLDYDGKILDYKAESSSGLYLLPQKVIGRNIQDLPNEKVVQQLKNAIEQLKQSKSRVNIEYGLSVQEEQFFYEARFLPLLEDQIIAIIRNITDRKKAEEEMRHYS